MVLEKDVLSNLQNVIDTGNIDFELRHFEPVEIVNERAILKERLKGIAVKEERIKASYREGIDTLDEYKDNKKLLLKERDDIERQLSELADGNSDNTQDATDAILQKVSNVYAIVSSDQYTNARKNAALRQIIDKIVYNRQTNTLKVFYILYRS